MRCLHASNWDYNKTFTDINIIITWRATNLPIKLDDVHARLLRSGFFTVHGRDRQNRCVAVCRPLVAMRLGINDPTVLNTTVCFVAFYVMNYMYRDGVIENNVCICDLEGAAPWNLPIRALQSFN